MAVALSTYSPTILVDVLLTAGTRYFATKDFYDTTGTYYKGTLLDGPQISTQLSDLYYGVEQSNSITLRFSNGDNEIDDTWDDIVVTNADEPRGRWVLIQRNDPTDGTTFEFRGKITNYSLGPIVELTIEMRDDAVLETLLPLKIVTTDEFTPSALDVGKAVNLCIGHRRNVPLRNIQNKLPATSVTTGTTANKLVDSEASFLTSTEVNEYVHKITQGVAIIAKITGVDSDTVLSVDNDIFVSGDIYAIRAHDYLIGYGTIESLWVDHPNDLGVKYSDYSLVGTSEYDFYDGSQASPFSGYAFIRFKREQRNHSGHMIDFTADVKGLEMGEASAERNFANVIKNLLSDATWGLSDSVDAASFAAAAADLDTIGNMYCDGFVIEQRKARDILNELLFPARARVWRAADGEWEIHIDQVGASVLGLGDNDGYYNNAEVISTSATPTSEALRHVTVQYSLDPLNDNRPFKEVDVAVHTGFGIAKIYELPFVMEDATAAHVLNYLKNRSIYSDDRATLRVGMEGRDLSVDKIVTVTDPERNLSAKEYIIEGITKDVARFELSCREYNAAIHGTFAVTPPTGPTGQNYVVYGPETWVGPIQLGDGVGQSGTVTLNVAPGQGDIYIAAGKTDFELANNGFILGIDDSDADKVKFYLGDTTDYLYWDGGALHISGLLEASQIHIPDVDTTANSFHVESDGDTWWGCTSTDWASPSNATAYILNTGYAEFQNTRVRGGLRTAVFQKDVVSAVGGNLAVLPADVLDTDIAAAADLITNGTFGADTDWLKGVGWSIAGGVANCDGTQVAASNLRQEINFTTGQVYRVSFTISNYNAGNINTNVGGNASGTVRSADGTYHENITCGAGTTYIYMSADADFEGDIDDVECYLVTADVVIEGNETFANNDLLRIKDGTNDEWFKVTDASGAPTYITTRDQANAYEGSARPAWNKGATVNNYRQSGDGLVYMTASETNAPYVSVMTHAGAPWTTLSEKVRIGNLNGYLGYAADIYGVGIGSIAAGEANLTFDPTNGLRLRQAEVDMIILDMAGGAKIGGYYFSVNDIWGGNAAIDNAATTIVMGNLDGTSKIALGASADAITIAGTESGFIADGGGNLRVGDADSFLKWSGGALTLQLASGETMTLSAGGDIVLTPSDADPALIKWSTVHNLGAAATAARGLCIWPTTPDQDFFKIGYDPVNATEARYATIIMYAFGHLITRVKYDANYYVNTDSEAGAALAYHEIYAHGGAGKDCTFKVDGDDERISTDKYLATLGGIHVGGTSDPGTDNLRVDGIVKILERAAAEADTEAHGQLWVKNTTPCELWFTDDAGTDTQIV